MSRKPTSKRTRRKAKAVLSLAARKQNPEVNLLGYASFRLSQVYGQP